MQPRDPWLFLNQGNGEFTGSLIDRHTTANGLSSPGILGAAMDYDADGWPDVVMGYWGDYDNDGDCDLHATTSPTPPGDVDQLFPNQGDGTFVRVTSHPLVDRAGMDWGAAWGDYDNDGFLDLLVLVWAGAAPHALSKNNLQEQPRQPREYRPLAESAAQGHGIEFGGPRRQGARQSGRPW